MAFLKAWAQAFPRIQAPPEWGIEPVPAEARRLGFLDYAVLWGDLGVGLLVMVAGALLVPGLGLPQALLAIVIGTLLGNLLLAATGYIGSRTGAPTMVLLRPSLGRLGSFLPTALNVLQLIGWGAFEIIIMAQAANLISARFFGFSSYPFWAILFALWCTLMAIGGPLVVVRQWLEKFAVWLVLLTTIWLTIYLATTYDLGAVWRRPGTGEMPFWLAVDLVAAMPISWMPLVADYNRFARRAGPAFWGTYIGYFIANVWFYGLGAMLLLTAQTAQLVEAIGALAIGWIVLPIILVDETDNAFADIYSAAVSLQNIWPRVRQALFAGVIGAICLLLALTVPIAQYENFLLLIGTAFVPLFGVLAADYFVVRRTYTEADLYQPAPVRWEGLIAWAAGVATYQALTRLVPSVGATFPTFIVSFAIYLTIAFARGWMTRARAVTP